MTDPASASQKPRSRIEETARTRARERTRASVGYALLSEFPASGAVFPTGAVPAEDTFVDGWRAGHLIDGRYEVLQLIGEGGIGKVYLVRLVQGNTETLVADKRAHVPRAQYREWMLEERPLWRGLPVHPHIVRCRFFRTTGEEVLIFAEYVEGGSLEQWIKESRLAELEVAIQMAWRLHAANLQGVVHQDVKPENVLVADDGTVRVTDFGIAARM